MNGGEELLWQQTVIGHSKQNAGLAEQHDEHNTGKPRQSTNGDYVGRRVQATVEKRYGDRRFNVYVLPANHAGEHARDQDIEYRADQQRSHDADGQIALRILAFLCGSGDGIKANVSEENVSGAGPDATETHGCESVPVVSPVV